MVQCINLNHDYENTIKESRAKFICPKCKDDITMDYLYLQEAGAFN